MSAERALYRERAHLIAYLAAAHDTHWAAPDPTDPHAAYRVVCLHTPAGQMTWHIHPSDLDLFPDLPVQHSDYDGHSVADKLARLVELTRETAVA